MVTGTITASTALRSLAARRTRTSARTTVIGMYVTDNHGNTLTATPRIRNSIHDVSRLSGAVLHATATATQNAAGTSGKAEMLLNTNGALRKTDTQASAAAEAEPVNATTHCHARTAVSAARTTVNQRLSPRTTAVSVPRTWKSAMVMNDAVTAAARATGPMLPPFQPLRPLSVDRTLRNVRMTCAAITVQIRRTT